MVDNRIRSDWRLLRQRGVSIGLVFPRSHALKQRLFRIEIGVVLKLLLVRAFDCFGEVGKSFLENRLLLHGIVRYLGGTLVDSGSALVVAVLDAIVALKNIVMLRKIITSALDWRVQRVQGRR